MGNSLGRVTRNFHTPVQVPGLEVINPEVRAIIYKLGFKYAGYKMTDPIVVNRSMLTGTIKYIEKTDEAKGFGEFMKQLELDAKNLKLSTIRLEFDQCSKLMQQKLAKHAKDKGFDCDEIPTFSEGAIDIDRVTGPNLQIYKEIKTE